MFFWIREAIGWSLLAVGLCLIAAAYQFVSNRQVLEAGIIVLASVAVMRVAVLLIRINTAARISQQSERTDSPVE